MVSVIIPHFNNAQFLEEALVSVFNQGIAVKVIVVDDGSEQKQRNKVQKIVARFDHVQLILQDNRGPSSARNRGLDSLCGETEYVAFLDADDVWVDGKIKKQIELLESSGADISITNCSISDMNLSIYRHHKKITLVNFQLFKNVLLYYGMVSMNTPTIVTKNKALRFDESLRYREDHDYIMRSGKLILHEDQLVIRRETISSQSGYKDLRELILKHEHFLYKNFSKRFFRIPIFAKFIITVRYYGSKVKKLITSSG